MCKWTINMIHIDMSDMGVGKIFVAVLCGFFY